MCNDSLLVRIVDAPMSISKVPQSRQKTTRQSPLPESFTFLCCLLEFIDFTTQTLSSCGMQRLNGAACAVRVLTLAGYRH